MLFQRQADSRPRALPRGTVSFIAAQSLSNGFTAIEILALSWLTLSPQQMDLPPHYFAAITGALFLPFLVVGPLYGRIAARWGANFLWRTCLLGEAAACSLFGAAILLFGMPDYLIVVLYAIFIGVLQAIEVPSRQTSLMNHLEDSFSTGYAAFTATSRGISTVAPLAGGALIAILPTGSVFLVNAASFGLVFFVALKFFDPAVAEAAGSKPEGDAGSPPLGATLFPVLAMGFCIGALGYQFPVTNLLSLDRLSVTGSMDFGVISAAVAVGGILGPWLGAKLSGARSLCAIVACFGAFELLMGVSDQLAVYCAFAFACGAAYSSFTVASMGYLRSATSGNDRARWVGMLSTVTIGCVPVGTLLVGGLAVIGSEMTLILPAVLCMAAGGISCLLLWSKRDSALPLSHGEEK
ncbi:MFS transporter [Streptomyces sp. NBC_01233]|uniref:MFS transporter n=1 Tax=Streptomyces sp. NBC_01233 TaxID=2903787 RepID=UPI002E15B25A|nr:MFS transporter [Streptomyces sp. NBC_01233]